MLKKHNLLHYREQLAACSLQLAAELPHERVTPTNVIQSNEYYSHGMPTANSWTRENVTGNNFLSNGGTELNTTSSLYDLEYRSFDPILGRMHQVDPMADKYSSITTYNYSFNNPVSFNDPSGAEPPNGNYNVSIYGPWSNDFNENYIGSDYGSRRAHGMMQSPMSGGYDDYVGHFNLDANMFGYGGYYNSYSRPAKTDSRAVANGINQALNSSFGGTVNVINGAFNAFENSDQGFAAGYAYNEFHNSWGNTFGGSAASSLAWYDAETGFKRDYHYTVAALDGPGPGDQEYSHYAMGFNLSLGWGFWKGTEIAIGGFSGGPLQRGQIYFSIGGAKEWYLNGSASAQLQFIRSRSGEIDLSGNGKAWGVGADVVSVSYSQSLRDNGEVSADVIGIGPSVGLKYTGDANVPTKTWSFNFIGLMMFTLLPGGR